MDAKLSIHPTPAAWLRESDLAGYVPAFREYLAKRQYAAHTQRLYLCCVAHFARWLTGRQRIPHEFTDDHVRTFLDEHLPICACPQPVRRCRHEVRAALRHMFVVLHGAGVAIKLQPPTAVDRELGDFDDHMHHARGLARTTRAQRLRIVRQFLQESVGAVGSPTLTAGNLRLFIGRQLQCWSPASAQVLASALRAYVRFRIARGDQVNHLLPVIVSPANWRMAQLPETLSSTEVARLLEAFGPDVPSVRRAYAMVRCLVDLGLRANEVAGLDLDDIDWNAGIIRICRGKLRRVDILPLPHATGCAIASYLHSERPCTSSRRVFVQHVAPVGDPIGPGVVRRAVRDAYRRIGLVHRRVHALRHTLASRLLEGGGTLKEVADILRHRELNTSLIYTKIDTVRLSAVALPWPGSAP